MIAFDIGSMDGGNGAMSLFPRIAEPGHWCAENAFSNSAKPATWQ
jgi:hypothetical protein